MPLRLVAPRKGKSPNFTIRGTHLKVAVDRSSGTDRKALARKVLRSIESKIERGEFSRDAPRADAPTFLSAAVAYMKAGRSRRYVAKLIEHFGETMLSELDQAAIDRAAVTIYPAVTPCTRNRCVYTPVSAILRHAGREDKLRRPKGSKGRTVTDFLMPDDATSIIAAAEVIDPELALLLKFLLYTGVRLGEALRLRWADVSLEESGARVGTSKNGDPRMLRLRVDLVEGLAAHRPEEDRTAHPRVFRFHQGGHMKHQLLRAKLAACGLPCPARRPKKWKPPLYRFPWVNFHTFRHTWASWMRIYGATDVLGLVATGNWRDPRSAARYAHAVAREEWKRVDDLPSVEKKRTA